MSVIEIENKIRIIKKLGLISSVIVILSFIILPIKLAVFSLLFLPYLFLALIVLFGVDLYLKLLISFSIRDLIIVVAFLLALVVGTFEIVTLLGLFIEFMKAVQ